MPITSAIRQEDYANFLTEANDLLQTIEQELFNLKQGRTPAQVHNLMRAAHTLKGAAASIEFETVKSVAHVLEDVFRALYNPAIVIDAEVETLLFQAYECLREPLMAEFMGTSIDESDVLNRSAAVLSRLQVKFGELFDHDPPMPTSTELGFDMVESMFASGVEQRLQNLAIALTQPPSILMHRLQTEAEVFLGLAESLQLSGFGEIAQTALTALAAHPDRVQHIAELALADFRQGQAAVLGGDRTQGGSPSLALKQFGQPPCSTRSSPPIPESPDPIALLSLDALFGDIPLESGSVIQSQVVQPEKLQPEKLQPERGQPETIASSTPATLSSIPTPDSRLPLPPILLSPIPPLSFVST